MPLSRSAKTVRFLQCDDNAAVDNVVLYCPPICQGVPYLVNLTATDGCGDWLTFVGFGSACRHAGADGHQHPDPDPDPAEWRDPRGVRRCERAQRGHVRGDDQRPPAARHQRRDLDQRRLEQDQWASCHRRPQGLRRLCGGSGEINARWYDAPPETWTIANARTFAGQVMARLQDHPSLKGWYLADEPHSRGEASRSLALSGVPRARFESSGVRRHRRLG